MSTISYTFHHHHRTFHHTRTRTHCHGTTICTAEYPTRISTRIGGKFIHSQTARFVLGRSLVFFPPGHFLLPFCQTLSPFSTLSHDSNSRARRPGEISFPSLASSSHGIIPMAEFASARHLCTHGRHRDTAKTARSNRVPHVFARCSTYILSHWNLYRIKSITFHGKHGSTFLRTFLHFLF